MEEVNHVNVQLQLVDIFKLNPSNYLLRTGANSSSNDLEYIA
jgi:hypothetical protein